MDRSDDANRVVRERSSIIYEGKVLKVVEDGIASVGSFVGRAGEDGEFGRGGVLV